MALVYCTLAYKRGPKWDYIPSIVEVLQQRRMLGMKYVHEVLKVGSLLYVKKQGPHLLSGTLRCPTGAWLADWVLVDAACHAYSMTSVPL